MRTRILTAGLLLALTATGCATPSQGAAPPNVVPAVEATTPQGTPTTSTDAPTPPSAVLDAHLSAGDRVLVGDDDGRSHVEMSVGVPYESEGGWRLDVSLFRASAGYAFSPQRISIDDYVDTWVYPTAAAIEGNLTSGEQLTLMPQQDTVTLLLSGQPPATGVISYHDTAEPSGPTWRYSLST